MESIRESGQSAKLNWVIFFYNFTYAEKNQATESAQCTPHSHLHQRKRSAKNLVRTRIVEKHELCMFLDDEEMMEDSQTEDIEFENSPPRIAYFSHSPVSNDPEATRSLNEIKVTHSDDTLMTHTPHVPLKRRLSSITMDRSDFLCTSPLGHETSFADHCTPVLDMARLRKKQTRVSLSCLAEKENEFVPGSSPCRGPIELGRKISDELMASRSLNHEKLDNITECPDFSQLPINTSETLFEEASFKIVFIT